MSINSIFAEVDFQALGLSEEGKIIFSGQIKNQGEYDYSMLFKSDIESKEIAPITCFAEKTFLDTEAKILYIQNSFGLFTYNINADR